MKLGFKIAVVILFFTFSTSLVLYLIGRENQQNNYADLSASHIRNIRTAFDSLVARDLQKLSAALEVVVQDPAIKEHYLLHDRNDLYAYVRPLFERLRARYRITHFYFILPDGHVFLRMHNRVIHGDLVERKSFLKARDTRGLGWEMELGQTAFALRAVMPYYAGNVLVGYVELAEEVAQFLAILKKETGYEFGMVGDKAFLDRTEWLTMRRNDGLRDNWDDLKSHVVLGHTSESALTATCFREENLSRVEKGQTILEQLERGVRTYLCGGFELTDTAGEHVGALLSVIDMTDHMASIRESDRTILMLAGLLFALSFAGGVLVSRSFTRPLAHLTRAANAAAEGNMDHFVPADRSDEIGQLAQAFNTMIRRRREAETDLQRSHDNLERVVAERTQELITANRRLQDLSVHLQNGAENERKRIAREIHDELGQSLTAMKMELAVLRKALSSSGMHSLEKAESLRLLIESTMASVKRISLELRPAVLDHLGLAAAIEWQAGEFEKRTGISCNVAVETDDAVPGEDRATAVFRIFQELLTNVARHAGASNVNVLLRTAGGNLLLQVEDDGRGLSVEQLSSRTSFGIVGIRERIHGWGGELAVENAEQRGARVTVRLPLRSEGGAT